MDNEDFAFSANPKFIYGMDPASKLDFFGIVIHKIIPRSATNPFPMAQLVRLEAVTHTSYLHIMEMLKKELFAKYPPYYMVLDYSTEKTISEVLMRDFGKERVEAMNFGNPTKNQLKDDGLAILKQGYKFPRPDKQQNMNQRRHLENLVRQLQREQMLYSPSGMLTFDHPQGEHNDLAIAWELSVHGCLKFMINSTDGPVLEGSKKNERRAYIRDHGEADPGAEIRMNPVNRITDEQIYYPS